MQKKYNLRKALYTIVNVIDVEDEKGLNAFKQVYLTMLKKTGLTENEFETLVKEDTSQTVGNLFYRIINLMNKKKLDTSHLE